MRPAILPAMRWRLAVVAIALLARVQTAHAQTVETPAASAALRDSSRAAMLRDLKYLAGPALDGRAIGSPGLDSAAEYLARQYQLLQIDAILTGSACDSAGRCARTYFQAFAPPRNVLAASRVDTLSIASNVIAVVPGTDPQLAGQWIVIGAHYDHIGRTGFGVRDAHSARAPHLGADDNASGTAAVLELARRIASDPPRRSVMFVHFAAEELGLFGSRAFVRFPPVPLESLAAMFNLDMVGRLRRHPLQLLGLESSPDWESLVERANVSPRMRVIEGRIEGGSDHMTFASAGIPAIHFFSGMHDDHHASGDTVGKIDADGMLRIVEFAERLIRIVADDDARPRRVAPR